MSGNTTPLSGSLRIAAALLLLGSAVAAGWLARSPWIVASLAAAFALAFVVERRAAWRILLGSASAARVGRSLLSVLAVQAVLVSLLYLVGAGLAVVVGDGWSAGPLSRTDLLASAALGLVCAALGFVVGKLETAEVHAPSAANPVSDAREEEIAELRLLDAPVTVEDLFAGIHHSHAGRDPDGAYDPTPTAASAGDEDKIRAAEARLGLALPERLRGIYCHQNGGSLVDLCIPRPGRTGPLRYDDVLTPFSGYNDLYPTEKLTTAWDSFLAFADPEDRDTYGAYFSGGTERMIVLAQWYRETLFLDYTRPGPPAVGFVDFDRDDWPDRLVSWPDFDTFFSALRRYEST